MARDGSGSYSRAVAAYQAGQTISSTAVNAEMDDVAAALTASLAKDGQTVPTANLPMGGYKHTGVAAGAGSSRTEYPSTAVLQDGGPWWCGAAGGSANAITLSPTPAIAAYAAGQRFQFIAGSNSTSTVTVAVSGLTTKAVQKGTAALASGDIDSGKTYEIIYDGTAFQLLAYELGGAVTSIVGGAGISASAATGDVTVALDIAELTEDTSPVAADDFVATYDASATASKKVKLSALPGTIQYGTGYTRDPISGVDWDSGNIAHGLGAHPDGYKAYLECKSADLNYSVGDRVSLNVAQSVNGTSLSMAVVSDATNIRVRYSNNTLPSLPNKTSTGGGASGITGASWILVVTPYKVA